ncbi:MAG: hypothetical protein JOZ90_02870 [Alphaproteobacteria bacterium]|nr:hypothetical protein [Alphaproteobacteria bacterium]MBV9370470.1 hypothetical protein [Alphaproteobacteria bacterium]MBV9900020.1 hypothetical protein [Alphaproteobacteria bacterium]
MILSVLSAALLMGASPAEIQVDVGRADWKALPRLTSLSRDMPTNAMVGRVEAMLRKGACHFRGQTSQKFDITVPYAVLVNPDGTANRVIVGETGCPALESYVGLLVLGMARNGEFRRNGEASARWKASEISFTQE